MSDSFVRMDVLYSSKSPGSVSIFDMAFKNECLNKNKEWVNATQDNINCFLNPGLFVGNATGISKSPICGKSVLRVPNKTKCIFSLFLKMSYHTVTLQVFSVSLFVNMSRTMKVHPDALSVDSTLTAAKTY